MLFRQIFLSGVISVKNKIAIIILSVVTFVSLSFSYYVCQKSGYVYKFLSRYGIINVHESYVKYVSIDLDKYINATNNVNLVGKKLTVIGDSYVANLNDPVSYTWPFKFALKYKMKFFSNYCFYHLKISSQFFYKLFCIFL